VSRLVTIRLPTGVESLRARSDGDPSGWRRSKIVEAEPVQLEWVLLNHAANSCDAMPHATRP